MSSKGKKKLLDSEDEEGFRKKKRLKKVSSSLFDDDDDDHEEEGKDKQQEKTTSVNNESTKRNDDRKEEVVAVTDVKDYFDKLQNDNKKRVKSEEVEKNEQNNEEENISPRAKKLKAITSAKTVKAETPGHLEEFNYLPFNNQKFVITGQFKKYSRDDLQSKIRELGGSVISAVSSRTNYLIHGEYLEDGREYIQGNKYKKATELRDTKKINIQILNEEEFLKLLPEEKQTEEKEKREEHETKQKMKSEIYENNNIKSEYDSIAFNEPSLEKGEILNQLWVEKYRPKHLRDLVGNNSNVTKLQDWLRNWEDVIIRGNKREVKKTFRGVFENINSPCALLSGPAGIGKTSTAKIVASDMGYNVIEFNASDERNKAAIEKVNEMSSGGITITSTKKNGLQKTCIIMDEVDGMSSGDKGGSTAILKLIEKTKCPIICICNDRQNPKIRTLSNKCLDLKFTLPQKASVVKRVLDICHKEQLMLEPNALELLWESAQGDLRQMLNMLQLLSKTYTKIQFMDIKKELSNSNKNMQTLSNPFEITLKLLNFNESSKLKIRDIMDLFFVDYELIPFFISENYGSVFNDNDKSNLIKKFSTYAQIATDLSFGDKVKSTMKKNMDFSLLPHFATLSCICPVLRIKLLKNYLSGRVQFPTAFGKISTMNKNKRLLQELCFSLSHKLHVSPKVLVSCGMINYVYLRLTNLLNKNDINAAVQFMEEYNITKDMLLEHMPCLRLPSQENLYDKIDSKIKASFTRAYNAVHVIKNDPNLLKLSRHSSGPKTPTFKLNEEEEEEKSEEDESTDDSKTDDDDLLVKTKVNKKGATPRGGGKSTPKAKASPRSAKKKK